jgi:hypothetical protein
MGWLYMHRMGMDGYATPKAYLDAQFTYDRKYEDGSTYAMRVLDSACVGNRVWYAATRVERSGQEPYVIALVCLVRWNPRDKEGLIFGYKDMEESMGPCEAECPERILNKLTPTTNEHALEWRERCRARLRLRSRKIDDGMRIRLATPLTFVDGHVGAEFIVVKKGSALSFRPVDGHGRYGIRNFRSLAYEVVPQLKVHRTVFAPQA